MTLEWSKFDRGVFLVNVLGIVYKNGKIVIGKRKSDPLVKKLTWTFPGGRPHHGKTLEQSLKKEVMKKTNLKIKVEKLIFVRVIPKREDFLNLYYFCKSEDSMEKAKAGEKFTEIKWIKPSEIRKYFKNPPMDPFVVKFLKKLK
jgi:ADP-ribose pyrophosphatase YjhB (NUDIX family)